MRNKPLPRITTMAEEEPLHWTVEMEVSLFYAMRRHKPVGVNRHFQMVCIHNKLNNSLSKKISAQQIWDKLSSMYDLQALNESEIIPFPNSQHEFSLPEADFKEPKERPFPRVMTSSGDADDTAKDHHGKDSTKDHVKDGGSKLKASASDKSLDGAKLEDVPKREQRKRTRQAAQSPANVENITPTTKRARRT